MRRWSRCLPSGTRTATGSLISATFSRSWPPISAWSRARLCRWITALHDPSLLGRLEQSSPRRVLPFYATLSPLAAVPCCQRRRQHTLAISSMPLPPLVTRRQTPPTPACWQHMTIDGRWRRGWTGNAPTANQSCIPGEGTGQRGRRPLPSQNRRHPQEQNLPGCL